MASGLQVLCYFFLLFKISNEEFQGGLLAFWLQGKALSLEP